MCSILEGGKVMFFVYWTDLRLRLTCSSWGSFLNSLSFWIPLLLFHDYKVLPSKYSTEFTETTQAYEWNEKLNYLLYVCHLSLFLSLAMKAEQLSITVSLCSGLFY